LFFPNGTSETINVKPLQRIANVFVKGKGLALKVSDVLSANWTPSKKGLGTILRLSKQGFDRVYENMPDLAIDVPAAYNILERFVTRCRSAGIVDDELVRKMPTRCGNAAVITRADSMTRIVHSVMFIPHSYP
jgi:hypothetical protein